MTHTLLTSKLKRWSLAAAVVAAALGSLLGSLLVADAHTAGLEVEALARLVRAAPGATIAEIGAGNGWLTVEIARRIAPGGHVIATERSAELRDAIRRTAAEAHIDNINVIEAGERSANLAADCCDAVFMRHVYHHLVDPGAITRSIRSALQPDGLLVIVECDPRPGSVLSRLSEAHSIDRDRLRREVMDASFTFVRFDDWPGHQMYAAVFRD